MPVAERFRAQAARTPDAVALEAEQTVYTYAELDAWVDAIAARLGSVRQPVVAVALPRSPALVASLLAVNRAGGTYLPIDLDLPAERIEYLLGDAAPAALLVAAGTAGPVAGAGAPMVLIDPAPAPGPVAPVPNHAGPDTPVYLMYTSGSTGRPKGVLMCGRAIDNLLDWHLDELGTGPGRRVAQFTAIGFDIAAQEIFSTLVSGATLVIPGEETRRDPWRLVRWLSLRRITDLFCPNLVVEAVCDAALEGGFTLPDLAHVAQAGEQLTLSATVRTFFRLRPGRRLYNHYGPTETHAATSYVLPVSPLDWPDRAPIGRPIWNTAVHLLDADLTPVAPGREGEVFVGGTAVARGYHDRPELTAERFLPDPFGAPGSRMYRTGDIARPRADGLLEYLGRGDQQVKIRGVRIELGEVDAAIRALPEVRDVTVLARGEGAARRLDAYLVAVPGAGDVVPLVRQRLAETLPPVMIPSTFTLLAELPANSNGKVDRNALPDPTAPPDVPAERGLAREEVMARLFAECLEVDTVSADDDFFMLGGHSLIAAKLCTTLRGELGLEVTIADIFRNPSVRKLTEALGAGDSAAPPITPVDRSRPLPVSFAQERLWILDQFTGPSAAYNVGVAIRLRGKLDVDALRAAVGDLVARHEALRTMIVADGPALRQEVLAADHPVPVARSDAPAAELARRPFDLGAEIPCRAHLLGSGDDHVLLLVIHHLAVDGWSIRPLAKDLGFAYAARLAGLAPPWRPLPAGYPDYAAWQRAVCASSFGARQQRFWKSTLDGSPVLLALETDRPRGRVLGLDGDRVAVSIDRALHRRIQDAAKRVGCTVFMVVHAALAVLMRERGVGDDVVLGATVAGRADGLLDDLVGFFVNTLVLRVNLAGDPSAGEILLRVREADLAAMEHQEYPFDKVVELRNPARSLAHNPVVQVLLAFQVGRPEAPRMPHLETSVEVLDLKVAKFDLTFELTECFAGALEPDGITGHLEFATDLFDRATAERMVAVLVRLLRIIAAAPDRHLAR